MVIQNLKFEFSIRPTFSNIAFNFIISYKTFKSVLEYYATVQDWRKLKPEHCSLRMGPDKGITHLVHCLKHRGDEFKVAFSLSKIYLILDELIL